MKRAEKSANQRVRQAIETKGFKCDILNLSDSTRTAQEAAETIGCTVSEIAKSLVFKTSKTKRPILVIASGTNRVDTSKVGSLVGEPVKKADADYIRDQTGFAIGGIPPVGHSQQLQTYIDKDLLNYETVWAAAGTPYSVFSVDSDDLITLTGGTVAVIKE